MLTSPIVKASPCRHCGKYPVRWHDKHGKTFVICIRRNCQHNKIIPMCVWNVLQSHPDRLESITMREVRILLQNGCAIASKAWAEGMFLLMSDEVKYTFHAMDCTGSQYKAEPECNTILLLNSTTRTITPYNLAEIEELANPYGVGEWRVVFPDDYVVKY